MDVGCGGTAGGSPPTSLNRGYFSQFNIRHYICEHFVCHYWTMTFWKIVWKPKDVRKRDFMNCLGTHSAVRKSWPGKHTWEIAQVQGERMMECSIIKCFFFSLIFFFSLKRSKWILIFWISLLLQFTANSHCWSTFLTSFFYNINLVKTDKLWRWHYYLCSWERLVITNPMACSCLFWLCV